jgi:alpha-aminoadipic semialdehyde synthase
VKATNSDNPIYVYNPISGDIRDGYEGEGIVVLAVDKLPSELPKEATSAFGNSLLPYIPELARMDYTKNFEDLNLPMPFNGAVLAHQGKLTPDYRYLIELMKAESKG